MKTFSKVFALVLALMMMLSVSAFAAEYLTGNNGTTLEFSFLYSSSTKESGETDTFASGSNVYVFVKFTGNTEDSKGMGNIDMPIGYNADKLEISTMTEPLPGAYSNNTAYGPGVAWLTWYNANGAYDTEEETYVTEGVLTRIKFTAKADITAEEIASNSLVQILKEGTATDGSTGKLAAVDFTLPTAGTITLIGPDVSEEEEFVPETKKGAAIACDNTITFEKEGFLNDYYSNVAVAKATLGADVPYSEAGFIWATVDGEGTVTETANKFVATDDDAVSGEGTFAYGVVMYAVPDGVTLKAIPYYVTADPNAAE